MLAPATHSSLYTAGATYHSLSPCGTKPRTTQKGATKLMPQDIWINLPVKDLARAVQFYTDIGFSPNPGPGNTAQSASFTIGEKKVVLMLFVQDAFSGFTQTA